MKGSSRQYSGDTRLRSRLSGVALAPVAHGAVGALDELLLFAVVLLLVGAYLWWFRRALRRGESPEARSPKEGGEGPNDDRRDVRRPG